MKRNILKKAVMYIICLTMVFSNVQINGIKNVDAAQTTIENLMPNGYFEEGLFPWNAYFNESNSGSAELSSDYFMNYKINFFLNWYDQSGKDNGPVTWGIMLENNNVSVEAGKRYKIAFFAKSTVERPIMVEFGGGGSKKNYFFALDNELKEYTFEFVSNYNETVNFKYHFGPISEDYLGNTTGIGITNDTFETHTISVGKVSMVDVTEGDVSFVKAPGIIGIEDGATYKTPVSATINYEGAYSISLTKDENPVAYTEGDTIIDDGNYILTAAAVSDSSIRSEKKFTISKDIDYSKTYYTIVSKRTDKVIEVQGINSGNPVVQNQFSGALGQFFTLDKVNDEYYVMRSLLSGNVISVDAGSDKLVQKPYEAGNTRQQWKTVSVPQGFVKFQNRGSGKVMDIPGGNKTDNLQLQQYTNNGNGDEGQNSADAQRFDLVQIKNIKDYIEGKQVNVSTEEDWKKNAFITPIENNLNPAGPIAVEWYQAPGNVQVYDIVFDGQVCKTVAATDEAVMKVEDCDIYTTEVALHTIKIIAKYVSGKTVETDENKFYVTKKGIGWGTLHRTTDMNLSWYYRWSTDPAIGTDETLTFVPMLWGNYGDEWLADSENKKYGTILSFNEPDWSDQSNVPVTKKLAQEWVDRYNAAYGTNNTAPKSVEEAWQSFMDSGLRVGSPATALAPPYCLGQITMNEIDGPDRWWADFEQLMKDNEDKGWDYDFVAIHSYNGAGDANSFIQMVKETHELTGKPIWITEFGVADWGRAYWNSNTTGANDAVVEFMKKVLPELDKLDYVERYAWFPFNPDDAYGGSSGLFDYNTGELTKAGKVYAMAGLPTGYTPVKDYTKDIIEEATICPTINPTEQSTTVKNQQTIVNTQNKQNTTAVKVNKPKKAVIKKITCKKKLVKVKLKKIKGIKGYQVKWSRNKKFKKSKTIFVKNKAIVKIDKFKKVRKGNKYFFKVRAYKIVNGKKIFGKYSNIKQVIIK